MSEDANNVGAVVPPGRAELVQRLMRKQAGLSLRVAAVFVILLIGLPLFNLYAPNAAGFQDAGFTLTWLILGVLFFPITWLLSAYFISKSDALEEEITQSESAHKAVVSTPEEAQP